MNIISHFTLFFTTIRKFLTCCSLQQISDTLSLGFLIEIYLIFLRHSRQVPEHHIKFGYCCSILGLVLFIDHCQTFRAYFVYINKSVMARTENKLRDIRNCIRNLSKWDRIFKQQEDLTFKYVIRVLSWKSEGKYGVKQRSILTF